MTDALKVVPKTDTVQSGVRDPEPVASGLADVLADTYVLMFRTQACHWNVEGPLFFALHKLTEDQYGQMFGAIDEIAERIRALGQFAPATLNEMIKRSVVEEQNTPQSAGEMAEALAAGHERLAHRLHALARMAGARNDIVTEDMATARSAVHEQAAWMLRAITKS